MVTRMASEELAYGAEYDTGAEILFTFTLSTE
ncbi:hypothetical protein CGLO_14146 [Colletotrichum gloeosporioides Cg-14]|uniref:Uncharacterized protein n=1 Tax=Colletotrichum gloeosporioides (strain Cg-14) TaxID=1237896 RepID=T0K237_COLGC|nr:hypothetical protein CGLO_14146 [Colletotrichum gloeosporioides Cg-14]